MWKMKRRMVSREEEEANFLLLLAAATFAADADALKVTWLEMKKKNPVRLSRDGKRLRSEK